MYWWARAARQNDIDAQLMMCLSYSLGHGVAVDVVKAYAWCDVATANGSQDAIKTRAMLLDSMSTEQIKQANEVSALLMKDYIKK